MANKRIRDLTSIDSLPDGALIPLDASSFSEAKAITESDFPDQAIMVVGLTGDQPTGYVDDFTYTAGTHTLNFSGVSLTNYRVGDALLLFNKDPSANTRVTPQQTVTISAVTGTTVTVVETLISGLANPGAK